MNELEFLPFSAFPRGTMLSLLKDAYSFEPRYERDWLDNWREADAFFYDRIAIADACGFVSAMGGMPVGFICWDPRHKPDYAEIGHNGVSEAFKRRGIGQKQLREAIRRIEGLGVGRIIVTTDEGLIPAQKNYERAGFAFAGYRENPCNPEYAGRLMDYELKL